MEVVPPGKVSKFCRIVDSISESTGKFLSWLIIPMFAVLCWEVLLRGVFNSPTIWVHECSQYIFAAYFALGGAYALKVGSFVNVDILIKRLKPRTRAIVGVVTALFTFFFLLALLWKGSDLALTSVWIREASPTVWGPPTYPLKITIAVGVLLLSMQVLAEFLRDSAVAISGKT